MIDDQLQRLLILHVTEDRQKMTMVRMETEERTDIDRDRVMEMRESGDQGKWLAQRKQRRDEPEADFMSQLMTSAK